MVKKYRKRLYRGHRDFIKLTNKCKFSEKYSEVPAEPVSKLWTLSRCDENQTPKDKSAKLVIQNIDHGYTPPRDFIRLTNKCISHKQKNALCKKIPFVYAVLRRNFACGNPGRRLARRKSQKEMCVISLIHLIFFNQFTSEKFRKFSKNYDSHKTSENDSYCATGTFMVEI